jgi:kynurenine formamidase
MRYPPERPTIDASIYTELSNDDVELSKYMLPRIELMIRQKSPGWALTPSFINGDEAEYYFQQTINGRVLTFKVEFVKENGVWKIFEF